jgi:hypothetical protein
MAHPTGIMGPTVGGISKQFQLGPEVILRIYLPPNKVYDTGKPGPFVSLLGTG